MRAEPDLHMSFGGAGRSLYAILHRVAEGIMVDLEPLWEDGELVGQLLCWEQVLLTRMRWTGRGDRGG